MSEKIIRTAHSLSASFSSRECKKKRRARIPNRPQVSFSLWSIMKECIGKELTKIPMPVSVNEPLSFLQRLTEDLEYSSLLDQAAEVTDPCEQINYVGAYAVSCYSTTGNRTTKPFNPLLGETYECDRMGDLGWKSIAEQVSHHPPTTAQHAEGRKWIMYQDFTMTSRFRGKYLSVTPTGFTHIVFKNSGNHYVYQKVTTTVHNIIVGKLWIENHGELRIKNLTTEDRCCIKFHPYSYFSSDTRKVTGVVKDKNEKVMWMLQGHWDKDVEIAKVKKHNKSGLEAGEYTRIWRVSALPEGSAKMYNFTKLAIELNEPEAGVAPTDSRNRPDQRLLEECDVDKANIVKNELEEKQRAVKRKREKEASEAAQKGVPYQEYTPKWFEKSEDGSMYVYRNDEYWTAKERQDWSRCPSIF